MQLPELKKKLHQITIGDDKVFVERLSEVEGIV